MYALVDCNNFYASCERLFNPGLIGKPVVVLSNNDGCVIARSNEAKALGIPMGAPAFEYKELFALHQVHVFSSNYELYGDISYRVMETLKNYSPEIEIYSIDECFMKFNGFEKYFDLNAHGLEMARVVKRNTGIPICIGFAETKALAKVANKIAKKFQERTKGVYVIDTEEKRIKALKWTKIEDVWGIGRQHARRLKALNINTAYQFSLMHDSWVRKNMTVTGLRLKHDLMGIASIDFEEVKDKQNIACTRSFDVMYDDINRISERLTVFSATVSRKLRMQNSHCNSLVIFLDSNFHRQDLEQHRGFIKIKTDYPTNSTIEINRLVQRSLRMIYKKGIYYKRAGIIVGDITPANSFQIKLFGGENPKHIDLMKVVDILNKKMGDKIKFGGEDLNRKWKMRQEKLSPCYTTRFSELLTINLE